MSSGNASTSGSLSGNWLAQSNHTGVIATGVIHADHQFRLPRRSEYRRQVITKATVVEQHIASKLRGVWPRYPQRCCGS